MNWAPLAWGPREAQAMRAETLIGLSVAAADGNMEMENEP